MPPTPLASGLAGASFGAALAAAGMYAPAAIIGQMQLQSFFMVDVFLTATAGGSLLMLAARNLGIAECKPRSPTLWNFFPYDGNIIGGLLLGTGMSLTGSCPGTILVQLATAVPSSTTVAAGAILGGILFAALHRLRPSSSAPAVSVYQKLHTTEATATIGLATLCGLIVSVPFPSSGPSKSLLPPVLGGLAIAGSQGVSLVLTANSLGVSTAYEQLGQLFWWVVLGAREKRPELGSTVFAAGVAAGAWTLSKLVELPAVEGQDIGVVRALVGGVLLTFGARIAGGCTSGHGISGMARLGVASYVTAVSMFGGGILTGLLLR